MMTLPQNEIEKTGARSISVLIADDSALMQERLKILLETIPGISVVAQTGDVASTEAAIQQLSPAVVILDLHLPGNGLKALEQIKAGPEPPVVIVFTAFSTSMHREKCLASGADYFFDKTTELKQFQATIRAIANQGSGQNQGSGRIPDDRVESHGG
jgi:DNA-binding NarL/FixJ family response regulator